MRQSILILLLILSTAVITVIACNNEHEKAENNTVSVDSAARIKRGEYLVNSIGCDDCHSPKRMGPQGPELIPELRFSGYPSDRPVLSVDTNEVKKGWIMLGPDLTSSVGMWGMSFAANLTSDTTGIGAWKEEQFLTAIRKGKSKGLETNRDLLPPMPWNIYRNMNDEDLKSIFAYLKTTRPVKNVVPAPVYFSNLK
jgi:cytochrome c553